MFVPCAKATRQLLCHSQQMNYGAVSHTGLELLVLQPCAKSYEQSGSGVRVFSLVQVLPTRNSSVCYLSKLVFFA